ncbi:AfsR/SARP family transcriptional regulator [Streptomyces hydrogenans]|uniref:AfsR/SARP family transcriptional regulator n=1 Tax=Streptomyces hydrogenans TaxID=1873719 RepID=UPI00332C5D62
MDVRLLGALEATEGGSSLLPTAGKPRQVFGLLAVHPGQLVPVTALIEELWGDDPPRSAQSTLQTYVLHLRKLLGAALPGGTEAAKRVLATRYNGYLLDVPAETVDALTFERRSSRGRLAMEVGDWPQAARELSGALELWRGRALADVPIGSRLSVEVTRLEQSRLSVLEDRIESDLALGRHQALLGELAALTARHPLHERLCAQYMLALYRSGQQWRALEAFAVLRRVLVDELGVEPSPRLRELQRAVLDSSGELEGGRAPLLVAPAA